MSGLVVAYGDLEPGAVRKMFGKIRHRGPALSGVYENGHAILAQNYGRADRVPDGKPTEVPLGDRNGGPVICYDGQMGNWRELAAAHGVADGPLREERLLLKMYRRDGADMLRHLDDAIFSLVICDGDKLLAARDLLGIKTLFYGRENGTLYLASELKSLRAVTDEICEFPAGHFMEAEGEPSPFAELPAESEPVEAGVDEMVATIRTIIQRSMENRVDFSAPTAGLLSGGLDSSVVCTLASRLFKKHFGDGGRLKTFAMGLRDCGDIENARLVADNIGSDHHELIVDLETLLEVLPDVIYHLESFDPSLVRSAASNYLISRYAREHGVEQLLSGEGGDEVFCGYTYLKQFPAEELFERQKECLGYLHSNASLRLDRMNQCHSVRVVAPLISGELLEYALRIPPEYKQRPDGDRKIEKWIFRKAFEAMLPKAVAWRTKQEFSQGSGSAGVLPDYFEDAIGDEEFARAQAEYPVLRSKEELHYFRIFAEHFGTGAAVDTVGQWVCV